MLDLRGIRIAVIALFTLAGVGCATGSHAQFFNQNAVLGTNLHTLEAWSPSIVFVDAMKKGREWIPHRSGIWDTGETINVDADGWPTSLPSGLSAGTLMFRGIGGNYPAGKYVCLYDGAGTIDFEFDATITSSVTGRIELDVVPSSAGIHLTIEDTFSFNPIRNVRVILPGFESTYQAQVFHPIFLEKVGPFEVIRFMDWQETNWSKVTSWAERTTPTSFVQTGDQGAALETMIELCNRLQADAWFCIPHQADDFYVTNFATMVRDQLDPGLRTYIEYSNEVWNNQFSQQIFIQAIGEAKWPSTTPFEARMRQYSARSVEIFNIFESVFGGTQRIVRVLASQHANAWTGNKVLEWNNAHLKADVLATAPYWGGDLGNPSKGLDTPNQTVDWILDWCQGDIETQRIFTATNKFVADTWAVELITYEGGQHMVGVGSWANNNTLKDKFVAANRHPRMQELYRTYVQEWIADGGGVFIHFNLMSAFGRFGSWGSLEYAAQPAFSAPKYLGLIEGAFGDLGALEIPAAGAFALALAALAVLTLAALAIRRRRKKA